MSRGFDLRKWRFAGGELNDNIFLRVIEKVEVEFLAEAVGDFDLENLTVGQGLAMGGHGDPLDIMQPEKCMGHGYSLKSAMTICADSAKGV